MRPEGSTLKANLKNLKLFDRTKRMYFLGKVNHLTRITMAECLKRVCKSTIFYTISSSNIHLFVGSMWYLRLRRYYRRYNTFIRKASLFETEYNIINNNTSVFFRIGRDSTTKYSYLSLLSLKILKI